MIIAEIVVIVGLYTFILLRVPQLRLAGGIVAAALLGGLFYYLLASDPEPRAEMRRVGIEQITLSELDLELTVRVSTLSGRVVNGSDEFVLTGIFLDVKLYDCPTEQSELSECFTIGEDNGEARVSVPPGQLRDFSANLLFIGLPEITGVLRWSHEITGVGALEK